MVFMLFTSRPPRVCAALFARLRKYTCPGARILRASWFSGLGKVQYTSVQSTRPEMLVRNRGQIFDPKFLIRNFLIRFFCQEFFDQKFWGQE